MSKKKTKIEKFKTRKSLRSLIDQYSQKGEFQQLSVHFRYAQWVSEGLTVLQKFSTHFGNFECISMMLAN